MAKVCLSGKNCTKRESDGTGVVDTSLLRHQRAGLHRGPGRAEKSATAGALAEEHLVDGDGAISVQVLREFYVSSRRLRRPLTDEQAGEMVRYFSTFRTLVENADMVLSAASRSRTISIGFWDALIVEAALASGADTLLTEDL